MITILHLLYRVWVRLIAYYTRISPQYRYLNLIIAIILLICLLFLKYKRHMSIRKVLGYEFLGAWLCFVLGITVFGRQSEVQSEINFSVISTIVTKLRTNIDTRLELLFNLFMLFPIGVAQNLINKNSIHLYRYWLMGSAISIVIEVLQLILHKGTFELVDILGNSIGYVIGLLVSVGIERKINRNGNK